MIAQRNADAPGEIRRLVPLTSHVAVVLLEGYVIEPQYIQSDHLANVDFLSQVIS